MKNNFSNSIISLQTSSNLNITNSVDIPDISDRDNKIITNDSKVQINESFFINSTYIINDISSSNFEFGENDIDKTNKSFTNIISKTFINNNTNDLINLTNQNIANNQINNKNNIDTTNVNIISDSIYNKEYINNSILENQINNLSNISNKTNSNKSLSNGIIDNLKNMDKKYIIIFEIFFPLILIILIIFFIIYCIRKKKKTQTSQENSQNIDKNGLNFQKGNKTPYNRIQNTSGFNVGLNPNNNSMSEIKVQNLKDEIHNIITNNSSGSNSSGKRKRANRKIVNNNKNNFSQKTNKGMQNEIKEEIKKYVIDEHFNNA